MYTNTVFVFNFNSETFLIHLFCNCDNCLSFSSTINILILVFSNTVFMSAFCILRSVNVGHLYCISDAQVFFLIALITIYSCARVPFQLRFDGCGDFFFSFIKRKWSNPPPKKKTHYTAARAERSPRVSRARFLHALLACSCERLRSSVSWPLMKMFL